MTLDFQPHFDVAYPSMPNEDQPQEPKSSQGHYVCPFCGKAYKTSPNESCPICGR